jgi:ABC-type amino acid transport system permease subunit
MSGTILYSLNVSGTTPLTDTTYNFYLAGAATSLFAIASISDFIFKKKKKFFPLMVWLFVSLIYQFCCLMISLFKEVEDRNITEFI